MNVEGGFVDIGESNAALRALLAQILVQHGGSVLVSKDATAQAVTLGDCHIVARQEADGMRVSIGAVSEDVPSLQVQSLWPFKTS
jgi:hypothetical protein